MSSSDLELQKMIRGFRVSDLQSLLIYAGRNKGGKKNELQTRALDLIKMRSPAIDMKIRELHRNRYQQTHGPSAEPPDLFGSDMYSQGLNDPMGSSFSDMPGHKTNYGARGLPNYVSTLNHQMMRSVPALNVMPQYPVNPDVKFKDLPFYDVLNDLLKPTSLVPMRGDGIVQEKELVFYLSPQDLRELDSNTDVQVQFRIGCLENNREQDDDFPSSVCIKVNKIVATLPNPIPNNKPGMDPKRPKRPLDITSLVRRSTTEPQDLCVSWASTNNKPYVTGVFLVRKQSSSVLIRRLKDIGVRNPDHTTALIKEKLCGDRDSDIATMSLKGSLICPLGKIKMTLPCRALTCTHLQCFDAALYIQMNEKKPKWICPVCDKPAVFKSLAIDGLFLDITRKVPSECNEVDFHENGSWTPIMPVKKVPEITEAPVHVQKVENKPKPKKSVEVVDLDSGSETEEETWLTQPPKKKPCNKPLGLAVILQNTSQELSVKPSYMYQPGSSKSPSSSKSTPAPPEKVTTPQLTSDFSFLSTTSKEPPTPHYSSMSSSYSPQSPSLFSPVSPSFSPETSASKSNPQPSGSASTTFQESADANNSSSTAGQCYDFDLYSLIQQNHKDTFGFQGISADETVGDDIPDIISID